MRFVKQRHKNTCAIAALAMLSGIGYNKIHDIVYKDPILWDTINHEYDGLLLEDIVKTLEKLNIAYKISFKKKGLRRLKNNALITITSSFGRHAVAYDAEKRCIFNPTYKNKITTIEDCMDRFCYYIEILA